MLIRRLPYVNAASTGLPPFAMPSQEEQDIYTDAHVLRWWRADIGVTDTAWYCCKTGAPLIRERAGFPELVTLSAYNNRPALLFANGGDQLWDGGAGLVPAGPRLSFVMVGRAGPADNAFPLGGADGAGNCTFLVHQDPSKQISMVVNAPAPSTGGVGLVTDTMATHVYADGPLLLIGSYDAAATHKAAIRALNGAEGAQYTPTSPAIPGTNNLGVNLHVGGVNGTGAGTVGPLDGGDIAEIMILDVALHVDTALRGTIEAALNARYGL